MELRKKKAKNGNNSSNSNIKEQLIIIVFVWIIVISFCVIFGAGNFYFTELGVLKKLQHQYPDVVITEIERKIFGYSKIVTANSGTFSLDSSLLFNYRLFPAEK